MACFLFPFSYTCKVQWFCQDIIAEMSRNADEGDSVNPGQLALHPTTPPPLGVVNSRKALAKASARSRLLLQTAMPRWGHLSDKT